MRRHYDAELTSIRAKVVKGHGHEPYPTLFSRTIAWDAKAPLLDATTVNGSGVGEGEGGKPRDAKKTKEQQP